MRTRPALANTNTLQQEQLTTSQMENSTTSRITAWLFGLVCLVFTVGYFIWASQGDTHAATEANLYPTPVLGHILSQLAEAAPPMEWNIPFLSIAVWIAWIFTTGATGSFLRRIMKVVQADESAATGLTIAFAVGFVVLSLVQLAIGIAGFAKFPLIPALFLLALISLVSPVQRSFLLHIPKAARWQWKQLSGFGKGVALIAAIVIAILLLPALTPPVQSDGVRYHIGAVQEYLKAGRIFYLPSNAYSNMPFLVEMHFLSALACGAPEATQLIHFTLALFTCLGIYALATSLSKSTKSSGVRVLALAAAGLYLATPMAAVLATWPFTDHGISFFLIASALVITKPNAGTHWFESGLVLGGLIGTKYTMAPIALALLVVPYLSGFFGNGGLAGKQKYLLKLMAATATVAGITGGTWYLKNLLYTGNPFYPLASGLFPGGEWTAEANEFLHTRADAKGMGKGLVQFLISPWNATFHWLRFEAHNPGPTLVLAILCIIAAVAALRTTTRKATTLGLIMVATFSYVIWFFSYQSNRLLLPTIALMLALVPIDIAETTRPRRHLIRITIPFAMATIYGASWALQWSFVTTSLTPPPLPYLLGNQSRDVYRYKSLTYARAFDYLNEHVPPGEKVLLIGEHRIFGADFQAVWSDWFDTPILAHILRSEKITSLQALLQYFKSQNIRWILINDAELAPQLERDFRPRFSDAEWEIYQQLRQLSSPGVKIITLPPGVLILNLDAAK